MICLVAYLLIKAHIRWRAHPTLEQYLARIPLARRRAAYGVPVRGRKHKELGRGERLGYEAAVHLQPSR